MNEQAERRREPRVRFSWPMWYGYEDNGQLFRGQVLDLNKHAIAFTADKQCCPQVGHWLLMRFSYPIHSSDEFSMGTYLDWSQVIRVDYNFHGQTKIVVNLNSELELSHNMQATAQAEQTEQVMSA
ncbi:MAG: hypothetical protein JEZ07_10370 [Phycisphaerae bacterium]|nr:hypothetical protein [Phycisphaerae bacterium]